MKNKKIIVISIGTLVLMTIIIIGLLVTPRVEQLEIEKDTSAKPDAASLYKGESIRFLVPSAPGGGFDEYVRLLTPYLEKHTGAIVKVLNLPGAGGMRSVNELYNSPKNGLTIAIMNGSAMVTNKLAGIKGADYNIEEFEYLGRIAADTRVLYVTAGSGFNTFDDIRNSDKVVKLGATGLGGSGYIDGVIIKETFSLNIQIIHGFDALAVVTQSMMRGNLVGAWGPWGSAKHGVSSGSEKVVLQSGRERIKDLPNTPTVFELIDKTNNPNRTRKILSAWDSLNSVGSPVATTPGTPLDRLQFLRNGFNKAMHDPEFLKAAERADRPIHYASGSEIIEIISNATSMEENIEKLFIRAIRGEL
jgi:tripartite-type tricarboxylate transporter receptor subunit TctC